MTTPVIRPASPTDAPGITTLLRELGYPMELDGVAATLRQIRDDGGSVVAVATDAALGVVGIVSLSCRPLLQGPPAAAFRRMSNKGETMADFLDTQPKGEAPPAADRRAESAAGIARLVGDAS